LNFTSSFEQMVIAAGLVGACSYSRYRDCRLPLRRADTRAFA